MAKKGSSSKKQAVGKTHEKKASPRKSGTSQGKKGSPQSKASSSQSKSGSQNKVGNLLKSGGCLLPTLSIVFVVIWLTYSLF